MIQVYLTFFRSVILSQTLSYLSEATSSQLCRNICECLHMRRCSSWYTSVAARSTILHASLRSTELSRSLNGLCDKRFRRSNDHTRALVSSRLVSPSATTLHYIDSHCPAMPPCLDCHHFTNDTEHASIKLSRKIQCVREKETKMLLVISPIKLGRFRWNLVHGLLN